MDKHRNKVYVNKSKLVLIFFPINIKDTIDKKDIMKKNLRMPFIVFSSNGSFSKMLGCKFFFEKNNIIINVSRYVV